MKLSFINPPFDIIQQAYGSRRTGVKYGNWAPYGVAMLAGAAKAADCSFEYVDAPVMEWTHGDVVNQIVKSDPDLICISAQLATREAVKVLIKMLREKTSKPIFLGGNLATTFTEQVMQENPGLDYCVMGEAEFTIQELIQKTRAKEDIRGVQGLAYRDGEKVIKNPLRPIVMDLETLPSPDFSIYDLKRYVPLPLQFKRMPIIAYLAARGCSYGKCTFCFESGTAAQKYRRLPVKRVIADLKEAVEKCGVREVAFWDDIFLIGEKWVLEFCEELKKAKLNIAWQCYGYPGALTKKMADAAAEAGCWNVYLGFESATQNVLNEVRKGVTLEDIENSVRWIREAGMVVRGSFILSLPGESPKTAMDSVNFAIRNKVDYMLFHPYFPEYGTELYKQLVAQGKLVEEYKGRTTAQYVPEGYKDEKEVEAVIRKAYRKFYFRPAYVFQRISRIRSLEDIRQYYEAFRFMLGIAFSKAKHS